MIRKSIRIKGPQPLYSHLFDPRIFFQSIHYLSKLGTYKLKGVQRLKIPFNMNLLFFISIKYKYFPLN